MAYKFPTQTVDNLKEEYDAIIVGSGGTGLAAAIQAHQYGLNVAILEKNSFLGGNTMRASSGMNAAESIVQARLGINDSMQKFYDETLKGGGYMNDREMLHYFVEHAPLAIAWLEDLGIKVDDLTITGGMSKKRTHRPSSMAPIGAFLVNNLLKLADERHIPIFIDSKVTNLLQDKDKKITGVEVNKEHQVRAKAVLLATGGFGDAKDLIAKYRPDLRDYKTTNQAGATGDGLKLADKVGAQLEQLELVQVHPTVQQDTDHAYLIGEAVRGEGAILVDRDGERFINELSTRKIVSNAITETPEHSAYLIFDQGVRDRVKAIEFYDSINLVVHGSTIEELAENIKVPAANLKKTLQSWNEAVKKNSDTEFGRTTGMASLDHAPYYAIHIAPAIHYTMGGIHIAPDTRVYDTNGNFIAGLYAAGEVSGGLHGNNRIGGNSIAETIIFGREAGKTMAKLIK
ncbi:Fumarate reductase flavoprotein subunit [Lactobacillus gasseri]|uniref:flavocytochrome c n=1 Tax=Lactobacillus gasseri TaxID=1596 RepID=UPI00115F4695|nr:flavocytochrome c [Lactobacillus gasseri]TQW13410.1 Fumarate reductase flavoprotein subunit [Lactobacillus gasseri]